MTDHFLSFFIYLFVSFLIDSSWQIPFEFIFSNPVLVTEMLNM